MSMLGESYSNSTKAGTAGGFLTILFFNLRSNDILKTIVLSVIGAVVSFVVSLIMRSITKWLQR